MEKLKKKIELLEEIPRYKLDEIAENNDIKKSLNIRELRKKIAEILLYKKIEEIYEDYMDAGNATIHLFKFKKSNLEGLKEEGNLNKLLKENEIEEFFKNRRVIDLTSSPQIVLIEYKNKEKSKIRVVLEFKGFQIRTRRADTRDILVYNPLITIKTIIHLDALVEIRTRKRDHAKNVLNIIANIFNNDMYEEIKFSEEDLENIIKWAKTFRNTIIKPLSGNISSLRMTAKQGSDLRNIDLYNKRDEFIGPNIKTGIYLQFEYGTKNRKIGFQINSNQGKLFFKSMVGEEEINFVLSKIKEIKGI